MPTPRKGASPAATMTAAQTVNAGFSRRARVTLLLLFLLSEVLFLVRINVPTAYVFDEFHYVPAAKLLLARGANRNWEHPPFGKYLIGAGIAALGDSAHGWRFMSAIFGALTIAGMYWWALAVLGDESLALWCALIAIVNQLLFVMARIAMLDVFMTAFLIFGMAAASAAWQSGHDRRSAWRLLLFAGVMFGLGTGVKEFGVVPWWSFLLLVVGVHVLRVAKLVSEPAAAGAGEPWDATDLWSKLGAARLVVALVLVPVLAYFISFLPLLTLHAGPGNSLAGIFQLQRTMVQGQMRVVTPHIYASAWYTWPLMTRPVWFYYAAESDPRFVRAILAMANPVVLWLGLVAVIFVLIDWMRSGGREAFLISAWYGCLFVSWAVIPRHISFAYYYLPALISLSLALGYVFQRWERRGHRTWPRWVFLAASVAMFAVFYPVLAAVRMPGDFIPK